MKKKTLYLECYSGISGDMVVGALLDLGADETVLRQALDSLKLPGYEIEIKRVRKNGIDACSFDVIIPECPNYDEGHGMNPSHNAFECNHHHSHGENPHTHKEHHHDHRNLQDVYQILDRLEDQNVQALARKIFYIIAEAEAKAHNMPLENVHFHEVGAIDSIVDIVSAAACIQNLGITDTVISELYEGKGHVYCRHGKMPVPAPATLNIVESQGLSLHICENMGEMVTPTGAAIAAVLKTDESLPYCYKVLKTGAGAGKKVFPTANILRAMLIEEDNRKG